MRKRILVVEDENYIRELLVTLFDEDFDILQAMNGVQAVEQYRTHSPHIVLMDVMMPKLDGLQASKEILAHNNKAKIIIITGVDDEDIKESARGLGVYGYHLKPFEIEDLLDEVENVLNEVEVEELLSGEGVE